MLGNVLSEWTTKNLGHTENGDESSLMRKAIDHQRLTATETVPTVLLEFGKGRLVAGIRMFCVGDDQRTLLERLATTGDINIVLPSTGAAARGLYSSMRQVRGTLAGT